MVPAYYVHLFPVYRSIYKLYVSRPEVDGMPPLGFRGS